MNIADRKARRDHLRTRVLEIDADLARSKRAFVIDGIERPYSERVALEAERAEAMLELRQHELAIKQDRKAESLLKQASLLSTLVSVCRERGLSDVVDEARRRSIDALMAAGQLVHHDEAA